jgi:hypothetical protein
MERPGADRRGGGAIRDHMLTGLATGHADADWSVLANLTRAFNMTGAIGSGTHAGAAIC